MNVLRASHEFLSDLTPRAVTAPLVINHRVLVGVAHLPQEVYCLDLKLEEFIAIASELYLTPKAPTWYYGLKLVWEFIGELDAQWTTTWLNTYKKRDTELNDTRLMAYLLDPDSVGFKKKYEGLPVKPIIGISYSCWRYLGSRSPYEVPDLSMERMLELLAEQAGLIYSLGVELPRLMDRELSNIYKEIELPLSYILYKMGRRGIGFDGEGCVQGRREIERELDALPDFADMEGLCDKLVERGIFLASSRRLRSDKDALREALEEYSSDEAIVAQALEWLRLRDELDFIDKWAGRDRIHPVWGQCSSATSRVYARNPAVQIISRNLRRFFIPAEGCVLVKADYSQAQLRILAHLSGDAELKRVFSDPTGDVHQRTSDLLGLGDRKLAKEINFGMCFGMKAKSLARKLTEAKRKHGSSEVISEEQAQRYIDGFQARYPAIEEFFTREWLNLKGLPPKDRVVSSLVGRKRRFTSWPTAAMERSFRATWTQQIEADLIKTAMVRLDRIFTRRGMQAQIVMMIHDSIWVECPKEEEAEVRLMVRKMMVTAGRLDVPLGVDFE